MGLLFLSSLNKFESLVIDRCPLLKTKLAPEIKISSVIPSKLPYPIPTGDYDVEWGVPFWAGQLVARYILDNPDTVKGKTVCDVGSGTGIAGIAAAMSGAKVIALDKSLLSLHATALNFKMNDLEEPELTWEDALSSELPTADIYIFANLFHDYRFWNLVRSKNSIVGVGIGRIASTKSLIRVLEYEIYEGRTIYVYKTENTLTEEF